MSKNSSSFANSVRGSMGKSRLSREPDNPRQSMEPSDMEPDDARAFFKDLMNAVHGRVRKMPSKEFDEPDDNRQRLSNMERAKEYYGNDCYQLLAGVNAALREWEESGEQVEELKEKYGGRFVEGVEIGERLAVYQGSDFTFTTGEDADAESPDSASENDSKFTFVK